MKELSSWPDDAMAFGASKSIDKDHAQAIVVTCIDWRFRDKVGDAEFTKAVFLAFGVERFFEIRLAGGAKNIASPNKEGRREAVFDDIRLALKKHIGTIILLNHANGCAKYADDGYLFTDPETERIFHEKELRLAGDITFSHFPETKILLGYGRMDDKGMVRIDVIKPRSR